MYQAKYILLFWEAAVLQLLLPKGWLSLQEQVMQTNRSNFVKENK